MKKVKCILFLLLIFQLTDSYTQNLCDCATSHPVDLSAFKYITDLKKNDIDTILFYRDWPYTNGFNGYGKIYWIHNKETFFVQIAYLPTKKARVIKIQKPATLKNDSILTFSFHPGWTQ